MRDHLVRLIRSLSYVCQAFRLVWVPAHHLTAVWGLLLVVQGVLPAATVHLTRVLVDDLVAIVGKGGSWNALGPMLLALGALALVLLTTEVLQGLNDWVRTAQAELVQDYVTAQVHEKSAAVDLSFYESPEYHDRLSRARGEASSRPHAMLEGAGNFLQNAITLVAMAGVLFPYGAWLPVLLIASTAPALYLVLRSNRAYHRWWEQTTTDRRWTQYFDQMLTGSWSAAEVRMFGLAGHFQASYQTLRRRLCGERLRLARQQARARVTAGAAALIISGGAMAWMLWRVSRGSCTLGDLALFYQAFQRGQNLMRILLSSAGQLYNHSLFLANLFEFLALEPRVVGPVDPVPAPSSLGSAISFRQVTFRYPGSRAAALEHFDLTVPAGHTVAIVGANGTGKTTLVKLLCRLYDPEEGRIEWDGIDIRRFAVKDYRRLITVLFQLPVAYQATAGQNIKLGDLGAATDPLRIEYAAHLAGADEVVSRLPRGYDTLLGNWFVSGTELSAGQWQRLSLGRAFFRHAQVIVLDEPTSFIDSWAEADWVDRFRRIANGRTAIVVTHRLSIAAHCDLIYVMQDGKLVEFGTHKELLDRGGLYAHSWNANTQPVLPLHVAYHPAGRMADDSSSHHDASSCSGGGVPRAEYSTSPRP